ncbi:MAG: ATP-binding cassette domain-containing protein, partial [Verrucomicrobia bacterium]|nr:ATP-binding cassette domain-containing protein [Verrucomicrobiota bacterium]
MSNKERNDLNDLKPSRQESNNTTAAALSVQDLAVYYPAGHRKFVHAVDGVSFQLYPGETLGLVGESGCGKTTLGRAILGLTPVTRGTILFEGRDISTFKSEALKEHRRHIQIVFQDPYSSLDPLMTIEQILSEPLKIHHLCSGRKERSEKIAGLLRSVGLDPELAKRYPH